ncbi:acyl-coenzyme A thioesterase THEM4 [Morone saxatilis]|uniref:acyl-coenzyme A thioesterase THEM4 n=1 Tax=Morone saxatilis TaxID=34816 RepID=UPI0015E1FBBE|nr:acyl-coenzyme A thioesterase THEM4 [Morone saxatilis]
MARSLGRICNGLQRLGSVSPIQTQLRYPSASVYQPVRRRSVLFRPNAKLAHKMGKFYIFKLHKTILLNFGFDACVSRHVHGGAIATMIDTVTGTHASFLSGPVVTANLNINYRRPIPLGSTVLIESSLDKKEGRKLFFSCKVTSTDGSKVHTETTVLFVSISASHLLLGG